MNQEVDTLMELLCELGRRVSFRDPLAGADVELTPPQMHAVLWLGLEGPLPTSVLAQRAGSSVPACTGIVDRLERAGIAARERDPTDRRLVMVRLTPEGEALAGLLRAHCKERVTAVLSALSPEDRRSLIAIVGRLTEAAREADRAPPPEE